MTQSRGNVGDLLRRHNKCSGKPKRIDTLKYQRAPTSRRLHVSLFRLTSWNTSLQVLKLKERLDSFQMWSPDKYLHDTETFNEHKRHSYYLFAVIDNI